MSFEENRAGNGNQNFWFHFRIFYDVYTRLSNDTNSKRHLLKKQRLKRSVLTGGRM